MNIELKHRPETLTQTNDLVKEYVMSLNEKEIFYDLGSCVGTYGILAYSRGLKVCCFEVDKVNFDALTENFFWIFGYEDNFKSFNIGIADKKGEIELRIGQPEIGGHHKTLALDSFCGHPISTQHHLTTLVNVDTLDNIIEEHNLPTPDHIKIDIDGSEYAFLKGANKSLSSAKSIIIELYEYNEYFQKIMNIIKNEYKFKLIKQSAELEPGLRDYWFIK
jgi:FkbM family methyltransferase